MNAAATVERLYPAVAALPQALRAEVRAQLHTAIVPTGGVLFDERQPCHGFPFVLDGAIRVT